MNKLLKRLVEQQYRDCQAKKVKPLIVNPIKTEAFNSIENEQKRAIFILHLAGFSNRKLTYFFDVCEKTIALYIVECYDKYPGIKKP